jgi:hypothetical protein
MNTLSKEIIPVLQTILSSGKFTQRMGATQTNLRVQDFLYLLYEGGFNRFVGEESPDVSFLRGDWNKIVECILYGVGGKTNLEKFLWNGYRSEFLEAFIPEEYREVVEKVQWGLPWKWIDVQKVINRRDGLDKGVLEGINIPFLFPVYEDVLFLQAYNDFCVEGGFTNIKDSDKVWVWFCTYFQDKFGITLSYTGEDVKWVDARSQKRRGMKRDTGPVIDFQDMEGTWQRVKR